MLKGIAGEDYEVDSISGISFAQALGMVDKQKISKKKKEYKKSVSATANRPTSFVELRTSPSCSDKALVTSCESDFHARLPEILPSYQSTVPPQLPLVEAMKRHQRTKLNSGLKYRGKCLPTLQDLCAHVIWRHIEALEFTGGIPYYILKPVLQCLNPLQLLNVECCNQYLTEETEELWELHCHRIFRDQEKSEKESWREMYMRCDNTRKQKFAAFFVGLQNRLKNSESAGKTILAHKDVLTNLPAKIIRKQERRRLKRKLKRRTKIGTYTHWF